MTLFGKVALVTGGSRGIGRAIVLTLAKAGADVAINYAGNTAAAEETAEAVKAMGRKAIVLKGDVADTAVCEDMIKQAVAELGRLDILVNNAGIIKRIPKGITSIINSLIQRLINTLAQFLVIFFIYCTVNDALDLISKFIKFVISHLFLRIFYFTTLVLSLYKNPPQKTRHHKI